MHSEGNRHEMLLSGSPLKGLVTFALPLIAGNIFQQLYNIVDAAVVGKYLGSVPLTGISVASPVMDILYALILGGSVGVSVLLGNAFGAGNEEKLKQSHATALIGGGGLVLLFTVLGLLSSRQILVAQGVSPEAVEEAMRYLRIILGGLICCFLNNYLAAALRAVGDSRSPFLVLLFASTLHAFLDLFLVGKMGMGIQGVACSTVFSQFFSAVCFALIIYVGKSPLAVPVSELRLNTALGARMLAFTWAGAIQQAVVSIGRMLIQGMLTGLGNEVISGYNMGMRTEQFLFCFSSGISAAVVVAISQNLGRGNLDRVKKFYFSGLICETVFVILLSPLCLFVPEKLIGFFSSDPAIIAAGVGYLWFMGHIYTLAFYNEFLQGFFRGLGRLRLTMAASIMQIVTRVFFSALLVPRYGVRGICYAVLIGWILLITVEGSYSLRVIRKHLSAAAE